MKIDISVRKEDGAQFSFVSADGRCIGYIVRKQDGSSKVVSYLREIPRASGFDWEYPLLVSLSRFGGMTWMTTN